MYFNLMPVIGTIGILIIIVVLVIVKGNEKREKIRSIDAAKFNSLAEEMKRENAQIRNDLQTVKEKIEAIDGMMKDI